MQQSVNHDATRDKKCSRVKAETTGFTQKVTILLLILHKMEVLPDLVLRTLSHSQRCFQRLLQRERKNSIFLVAADTSATMAAGQTAIYDYLETWTYPSVFWLQQGVCRQVQKATT